MTYNLFIAGELEPSRLAAALASLTSLPVDMVDVSSADADDRNWDAAVSCTYEQVVGDLAWSLDIYLTEAVGVRPTESQAAAYLAKQLGTVVLYPGMETLPSSYWLVAPEGPRTRARVYAIDEADRPTYRIDAVESPVSSLPSVPVAPQPEVIREHRVPTLLTDELNAWLSARNDLRDAEEDLWFARTRLGAWEILTVRMASGWPPDGWYPVEFYREDLETRDELAAAVERLSGAVAGRFKAVLRRLDEDFRSVTVDTDDARLLALFGESTARRDWWWQRLPEPTPWREPPR